MKGYRPVPRRIEYSGDISAARQLLGKAESQLKILEESMSFQGLAEGHSTKKISSGVVIECWSSFTLQGVKITVKPTGGGGEEEKGRECFCNCDYAVGQITDILPLEKVFTFYHVLVCNHHTKYVQYEYILASDFVKYQLGQRVIVMNYHSSDYDCFNTIPEFPPRKSTGCLPIESEKPYTNTLWLSTYRIVPLCANLIRKWEST